MAYPELDLPRVVVNNSALSQLVKLLAPPKPTSYPMRPAASKYTDTFLTSLLRAIVVLAKLSKLRGCAEAPEVAALASDYS